jgi:hypothetical protein
MTQNPTLYYIDAFSDERIPCAPTLEGWAAWLAKPATEVAEDWPRDDVSDGDEFEASVMERLADVAVTLTADGHVCDRQVEADADFFAESTGSGWDAESMTATLADFVDYLREFDLTDPVDVAVCRSRPSVRLRFNRTAAGPVLIVLGPNQ